MNKKTSLFGILIICILLASPVFAKEDVTIKIGTEEHPFSYDGYITIELKDSHGKKVNGGKINYTITDAYGNYKWQSEKYNGKIAIKVPNGKYTVKVKYDGNSKYKAKSTTKSVTVYTDGSLDPYTYYDTHNYGDNLLYDEYIYDYFWDEEIYDDPDTYDGEWY